MQFFKKMFSKKKDEGSTTSGGETFACDNCGQTRPMSQKKQHAESEASGNKNVCEFC